MNTRIVQMLKDAIAEKGLRYMFVARKSGIEYPRLMRIFNQGATISGSELLSICRTLGVAQDDLMALLDQAS